MLQNLWHTMLNDHPELLEKIRWMTSDARLDVSVYNIYENDPEINIYTDIELEEFGDCVTSGAIYINASDILNINAYDLLNIMFDYNVFPCKYITNPYNGNIFDIIDAEKIINYLIVNKNKYIYVNLHGYLFLDNNKFKFFVDNFINYSIPMECEGSIVVDYSPIKQINKQNIDYICDILDQSHDFTYHKLIKITQCTIYLLSFFCELNFFQRWDGCEIGMGYFDFINKFEIDIDIFLNKIIIQLSRKKENISIIWDVLCHLIFYENSKINYFIDELFNNNIIDNIQKLSEINKKMCRVYLSGSDSPIVNNIIDRLFEPFASKKIILNKYDVKSRSITPKYIEKRISEIHDIKFSYI